MPCGPGPRRVVSHRYARPRGFHGQTITHQPDRRFTWQIGDGAALARALGVRVVSDLRSADVAAGGQGPALVPVYHAALAADLPRPLAVVNVGGVGNVTWIGVDGELLAFDTGLETRRLTTGARDGPDSALTQTGLWRPPARSIGPSAAFSEHRFFAKVPPKSLDRGTSVTPGLRG